MSRPNTCRTVRDIADKFRIARAECELVKSPALPAKTESEASATEEDAA
jgi:hypothetical protein